METFLKVAVGLAVAVLVAVGVPLLFVLSRSFVIYKVWQWTVTDIWPKAVELPWEAAFTVALLLTFAVGLAGHRGSDQKFSLSRATSGELTLSLLTLAIAYVASAWIL